MVGTELVNDVLLEWEGIVNRVVKSIVGEKLVVCGKAGCSYIGGGMIKQRP